MNHGDAAQVEQLGGNHRLLGRDEDAGANVALQPDRLQERLVHVLVGLVQDHKSADSRSLLEEVAETDVEERARQLRTRKIDNSQLATLT